jgi:hypothetical protein
VIPKRLSRRTFLRGAGGIALALPLLEAMEARADTPQKRFIALFTPNGTLRDDWLPQGTEDQFTLSTILAPLAPYQSDVVVISDLDNAAANDPSAAGFPHPRGLAGFLTGTETVLVGGYPTGGGMSIDQRLVQVMGQDTRFPSVNLGVLARGADVWSNMCYSGVGLPVPPQSDPSLAANALFTGLDADPSVAALLRARRKSVLDTVLGDLQGLQSRVSSDDRHRLDAHATAIRDIEMRVTRVTNQSLQCKPTVVPDGINAKDPVNYEELATLQTDILVMALQCDLTRVATLQFNEAASHLTFSWLNQAVEQHSMSHAYLAYPEMRAPLIATYVWYAQRVAYLLGKLQAAPDGTGTLLDNSLLLWGNELGRPDIHSLQSIPFVLAGGAGGALRGGRFLQYNHDAHNALLVSCLQMMGAPDQSFGNPAFGSGPLPRL